MRGRRTFVIGIVSLLIALVALQWTRSVPNIRSVQELPGSVQVSGKPPVIPWPAEGESALLVPGVGWIGQHGRQTPVPIASVAKLMTAYLVLQDYPLQSGQNGPKVRMTAADVAEYEHDVATGQSCVRVAAGETLSERQLLEALLLPSANNAANILARFDAGSTSAFVGRMNATAKQLGMVHTTYADASGVDPATVSTAVDQIKIAEQDMTNDVFTGIVAMKQVTLPVAGVQYNVDYALGHSGIVGIKTGSTDEAGGCFVFATRPVVDGRHTLLIGAILGQQPNSSITSELMKALGAGEALAAASSRALTTFAPVPVGTRAAALSAAWGQTVQGVAARSGADILGWPGMTYQVSFEPGVLKQSVAPGQQVGTLVVRAGEQVERIAVRASAAIERPSTRWRLERNPLQSL